MDGTLHGMEADGRTLADYIAMACRRKFYILAIWVVVSIAAVIVAYNLPHTYRSSATLLMELPVQKNIIQPDYGEPAEDQISSIYQKVITADKVLSIVDEHRLYQGLNNATLTRAELADRFKQDIEIHLVKSDFVSKNTDRQTAIAFTLSFLYYDAAKARDIAAALANLFIAQNDSERTQRALKASAFLTEESEKLSREIKYFDGKLAAYKQQYKDSLPDQMQAHLAALDRTENELRDTQRQIRVAQERLTFLGVELARAEADLPEASGNPADPENKVPLTLDEELKLLKGKYLKLAGRYTPSHPDVVRVKRRIEALELELQNAPREEPSSKDKIPARSSSNPIYLSIKAQYESSRTDIDSLLQQKSALQARLEMLRQQIAAIPEVERGYSELLRERDHAAHKYNQLKDKLLDARLVQTLEEEQHGQTLTMIEPPTVPMRPEKAIRRKVAFGGAFLGLALGFGCALLMEFLDSRIRGYRALAKATGLMPVVVIPYIESSGEIEQRLARQSHRKTVMVWTGAACLVLSMLVIWLLFATSQGYIHGVDEIGRMLRAGY
jgi:succinoglycan biosynthesis transport protein ExoP